MTAGAILARRDDSVLVLSINRPARRNAIDTATMRALGVAIADAIAGLEVRCIVLTGAGEVAFSAGGDLDEMAGFSPLGGDGKMAVWQEVLGLIERSNVPVIAAVNGYALGGGTELAMACHIRIASDEAVFGQPEIALDHVPGGGATQRLPRLIPRSAAYEYLLTGESFTAADALRLGLVSALWPKAELLERAVALAQRIALRSPVAVRLTMEAIHHGLAGSLDAGLRLERALAGLVLETPQAQDGMAAFLARRRQS